MGEGDDDKKDKQPPSAPPAAAAPVKKEAAGDGRPKRKAAAAAAGAYAGADADGDGSSSETTSDLSSSDEGDVGAAKAKPASAQKKAAAKAPPAKKSKPAAAAKGGAGGKKGGGGGDSSSSSSDDDDDDDDDHDAGGRNGNAGPPPLRVDARRVRPLNAVPAPKDGAAPVLYWMSRDQRADDNWALLHALERAAAAGGAPVAVAFCLVPSYLGAGARQFGFLLRGLRELEAKLKARGVGFFLLRSDDPGRAVAELAAACRAGLVVTDYSPLRLGREWRARAAALLASGGGGAAAAPLAAASAASAAASAAAAAAAAASAAAPAAAASASAATASAAAAALPLAIPPGYRCCVREVDAHNVVPVWVCSDKREYAARTIRPKVHRHLVDFLREFPPLPARVAPAWPGTTTGAAAGPAAAAAAGGAPSPAPSASSSPSSAPPAPPPVDWDALLAEVLARGADVPEVAWAAPGERAARAALDGPGGFLDPARLALYDSKRNDPGVPSALSGLSPWMHFGQLAPQRAALEASRRRRGASRAAVDSFLEEVVVRRELSDNHCHYTPDTYDSLACCSAWALDTLRAHAADPREKNYTRGQLERGQTHDELWNAAQKEMVVSGKMHGFMRMYWAKKVLEWTDSPERAYADAIYLNDRWSLDGRDPNGYVGVLWSIGGIHDMGWAERAVFGKIRYMNYAGCKRKFDIARYVARVEGMVREARRDGRLPPCLAPGGGGGGGGGGVGRGGAGAGAPGGGGAGGKKPSSGSVKPKPLSGGLKKPAAPA